MQETCVALSRGATTRQVDSSSIEDLVHRQRISHSLDDLVRIEDLIENPCKLLDHPETWEQFANEDYKQFFINNLFNLDGIYFVIPSTTQAIKYLSSKRIKRKMMSRLDSVYRMEGNTVVIEVPVIERRDENEQRVDKTYWGEERRYHQRRNDVLAKKLIVNPNEDKIQFLYDSPTNWSWFKKTDPNEFVADIKAFNNRPYKPILRCVTCEKDYVNFEGSLTEEKSNYRYSDIGLFYCPSCDDDFKIDKYCKSLKRIKV